MAAQASPTTASVIDTLKILTEVVIPTAAKGPIIRRPKVVGLTERLDLDARAVRRMQTVRDTYGQGPLKLAVPFLPHAVILDPANVREILDRTPDPFATATTLKRAALSHFEPKSSLISHGPQRTERRSFNERVLETDRPVHHLAGGFIDIVQEEAATLLDTVDQANGTLTWDPFFEAWFRVVRRVVFGDAARDDHELTDIVAKLRADANWAFFKPKRKQLRQEFFTVLQQRITRSEPGSLASMFAGEPLPDETEPLHQVPQWLFAFDPAGMTTFRALALLATHPEHAARAREELDTDETDRQHLPFLRATVLESLRLWPTTPLILRQSTKETKWGGGSLEEDVGLLIYAPFFHRDDKRLPFADRFAPDVWEDEGAVSDWPLIPFSAGPAVCPGRNLVLLVTSAFLAAVIEGREMQLIPRQRLGPGKPLPGTLNNYGLRFRIMPSA
jgi:cytochrome P450